MGHSPTIGTQDIVATEGLPHAESVEALLGGVWRLSSVVFTLTPHSEHVGNATSAGWMSARTLSSKLYRRTVPETA